MANIYPMILGAQIDFSVLNLKNIETVLMFCFEINNFIIFVLSMV